MTVSSGGNGHILKGDDNLQKENISEEVEMVEVDVLTPHLTRSDDWFDMTEHRVKIIKDYLSKIGSNIPVYLQEEARRGTVTLTQPKKNF